jgi:hypothetical protein
MLLASSLHRRAYQHKTSKIIEHMLTEMLCAANDHILLPGLHGPVRIVDAIYDMVLSFDSLDLRPVESAPHVAGIHRTD